MDSAAPLLLSDTPPCLPICETIGAIVRIGRRGRLWSWHDDGLRSWHHDGLRRWSRRRAATMMDSAAPLLLVSSPSVLRIDCAVEGIHRSAGCWRSCGRLSRWLSHWRSWRRSRRGCWKWCGWNGGSGLRESCGAAPSHRSATKLLLGWTPIRFPLCETLFAKVIVYRWR